MIKIESELEYARIALTNALSNHELQGPLALVGYGPDRLQQGMELYLAAVDWVRAQTDARKAKVTATQEFYKAWAAARLRYTRDLGTMRVILRDQPDQRYYLQLPGKRITSFVGWHAQARRLYEGIQEKADLQELLNDVGITPAHVAEGLQALEAVRLARTLQVETEGAAKVAGQRRNEALTVLRDWIELFGISARKALAATPGQLVILGLDVTLNQERRRKLELKKKRAENAKEDAEDEVDEEEMEETEATEATAPVAPATPTTPATPSMLQQLMAVLNEADQSVAKASELAAAVGE